jgi:LysR family glycine cleavage system transcriptional activator
MPLPPFKGVLAFEVVSRLGSISQAAEELNLTVSAVSHQIANLEEFVGARLFDRSPRGLRLTLVGQRFAHDIEGALGLLTHASQQARLAPEIEVLRIHASPSFASLWLMPRLLAFRALHPDIRVQLSASHHASDFSREEVDLDIRYGSANWEGLHVETLFTEVVMPMISPSLKVTLQIQTPEDLAQHDLIFSAVNVVKWPAWFAAHGVEQTPKAYALSFDRAHMAINAAVQGLGIALDSNKMAEGELTSGRLVPVFHDQKGIAVHAHHLVYPKSHAQWPRVEKFAQWLKSETRHALESAIT